jgi:hypothetical protein
MKDPARIAFSRRIWWLLFLLALAAVVGLSFLINLRSAWLTAAGSVLLLSAAFFLAMLFRELLVPSWLERRGGILTIRWNNWWLSGKEAEAGLSGRHRLRLVLEDPRLTLTPVGPLMGLSGMALKPLLAVFLPAFLAQSYYFRREALLSKISTGDHRYTLVFPAFLLGKRKVKKWLG